MSDHNPLRILGWAAVSTRAQAEDVKSSIPNQVSFIDTWCTDNGHILVDTLVVRDGQIVGLIPDPRPPVGRKRKA